MSADLSVECSGADYASLSALAGVLVAIWPVGAPVVFGALLAASRTDAPWAVSLSHAIWWLHAEYTERCFYWSLLELARTLLMTGFVFFIPFEMVTLRLVLAILVAIGHLVVLQAAHPYRQRSTELVAILASLSLLCTLFAALLVRFVDISDERLLDEYGAYRLTLCILVFNFGVVLITAAFIALEARGFEVLRLQSSGRRPALTLAKHKRWQLFLSVSVHR